MKRGHVELEEHRQEQLLLLMKVLHVETESSLSMAGLDGGCLPRYRSEARAFVFQRTSPMMGQAAKPIACLA